MIDLLLRLTRLRDRLRCPKCSAVGTYKPHGGRLDRDDKRRVRRWMCKWCGYYRGPEGERQAGVNVTLGVWQLRDDYPTGTTPQEVIARSEIPNAWPWRG